MYPKTITKISRIASNVASVILVVLMVLIVADVFLRYICNSPITGVMELSEYMLAIVVFFGLAYVAIGRANVTVDVFFYRLPQTAKKLLSAIDDFISLGIAMLITWQLGERGWTLWLKHQRSDLLHIPDSLIMVCITLAGILLCVVLLVQLVYSIREVTKK